MLDAYRVYDEQIKYPTGSADWLYWHGVWAFLHRTTLEDAPWYGRHDLPDGNKFIEMGWKDAEGEAELE